MPYYSSYQLYRNTTLGSTLQESLDELIQRGDISIGNANEILRHFDKVINKALATKIESRLMFKAGQMKFYRHCDNVWTLMLTDVEIRNCNKCEVTSAPILKIVACDGKAPADDFRIRLQAFTDKN